MVIAPLRRMIAPGVALRRNASTVARLPLRALRVAGERLDLVQDALDGGVDPTHVAIITRVGSLAGGILHEAVAL